MDDPHTKRLNPDRAMSDAARCLICLNTFSGQPLANPQHCAHLYCLTCITEWAKTSNSCPVDRLEFHVLYQRSNAGGNVQKIVKVEGGQGNGLEEDDMNDLSVCEKCGRSDCRHLMLLCANCDTRYHIGCLTPPLPTVPSDDWFCQDCIVEGRHTNGSSSRQETDIDEGEIMDLLAEVAPTSSRLRASTTNRPAACATARKSERIRHLSRRGNASWSQTIQHVPKYLLKSSDSDEEDSKTERLLLNRQKSGRDPKKRKRR